MDRKRLIAVVILAACGAALALGAAQAPNPAGTWLGRLVTNDNRTDGITLVLKVNDSGYEGIISDELGAMPPGTKLRDIVLKDSTLSFVFDIFENGTALAIHMRLKIEGQKMKGAWEDPQNETSGPVELARK